jgi:hypothetical protein
MAAAPSSVRRRFLLTIRCTSSGCSEANADRLPSRWCVAMAKATACSSLFSVSQFVVCNVCMMCLCAYADMYVCVYIHTYMHRYLCIYIKCKQCSGLEREHITRNRSHVRTLVTRR